ncbi:MAG: Mu transposase domain-containing protein [Gammaproteobacteria bacterium]
MGRAYYSVPYRLIGSEVDVRLSARAVEIFHQHTLVATHPRARERGWRSTRAAHRPERHVAVIEQNFTRVLERAATIGPATVEVLRTQAARKLHPEETLRSAQGILRLAHDFSPQPSSAPLRASTRPQELQLSRGAGVHRDP